MPREKTKLQHACAAIGSAVEQGIFAESRFLPSANALARMTGVSASTALKAIRLLKRQGRITDPPRGSMDGSAARSAPRRSKHLAVQARIQQDLLNGRLRHDHPLPSEKELTARYGVSRMTLRKALVTLTEQGVLASHGPRFSPAPLTRSLHLPRQRIVLLGQGINMGANITWGYWHQENFKQLEVECARAGISLDIACFQRHDAELRIIDGYSWLPVDINDRSGVMGYIYLVPGEESKDDELLRTVVRANLPVAVFDEVGGWPNLAFLRSHPNVRVFRNTVTSTAAQQVARYVLELGHRSAIFISPFHQWEYSRRRLNGLVNAFSSIDDGRIVSIHSGASGGEAGVDVQGATEFYTTWIRGLPSPYAVPLERHFGLLSSVVGEGAIHNRLQPLFERAWAVNDATVWIAVNDTCADAALEFTKQKKIPVPGRLSIMSFDDLPVALTNGISSYNFNYPAVTVAMLRYITHPRLFPVSKPAIEIEGNVIPRRTTGRVRPPS